MLGIPVVEGQVGPGRETELNGRIFQLSSKVPKSFRKSQTVYSFSSSYHGIIRING